MEPFIRHTGTSAPLRRSNVDTDQIIPAEYLKRITRDGFEDGLFSAWRKDPDFVLNRDEYQGVSILVAGPVCCRSSPVSYTHLTLPTTPYV